MTEAQKVRQIILEYLATQDALPSAAGKIETEIRLAGYDHTQAAAELETLEALGYVHRLPSTFGCRWIILDRGKEALTHG